MRSRKTCDESSKGRPTVVLREARAYVESQELPKFAWGSRWLRGNQYALMLRKMDDYCQKFKMERCGFNQHPIQIYQKPENGFIYFLEGSKLQALGYPRIQAKKRYCWKKMNFPTLLPKADPLVKYLVASSFVSGEIQHDNPAVYRMHVVVPLKFESRYLLCHIRRVNLEQPLESQVYQQGKQLRECFPDGQTNFYRLFLYLHNTHHSK